MSNEFQYRLQKSLSAARMTAAELSEKSGISEANISNYINGKYIAKQDKCFMLAKALNVDPWWLMSGEEPTATLRKAFEEERIRQEKEDAEVDEIVDIYMSLQKEKREMAKSYLLYLKS